MTRLQEVWHSPVKPQCVVFTSWSTIKQIIKCGDDIQRRFFYFWNQENFYPCFKTLRYANASYLPYRHEAGVDLTNTAKWSFRSHDDAQESSAIWRRLWDMMTKLWQNLGIEPWVEYFDTNMCIKCLYVSTFHLSISNYEFFLLIFLEQHLLATEYFTCIVPETTPVQKSQVLVVVILQGHFLLLLEAGK